jgi:DNA-binding response OmpR family regulator
MVGDPTGMFGDRDSRIALQADLLKKGNSCMSKLVLVIDDSSTVRKIVETSLSREGFTILNVPDDTQTWHVPQAALPLPDFAVVSFPDGVEAMRWLSQPTARIPDLVLLDIGLPKLDGYESGPTAQIKAWI